MNLSDRFLSEKKSVSWLARGVLGNGTGVRRVCERLERELGEQVLFDHRAEDPASLRTAWSQLPSLVDLLSEDAPIGFEGLASATYAFRMLALANIQAGLETEGSGDAKLFQDILTNLGHHVGEVKAYQDDFVR